MVVSEVGATTSCEDSCSSSEDLATAHECLRTGPTEMSTKSGPANTLIIFVRDQAGEETYFRVSKTTRMQKVFNTYAARNGLFLPSLRFLHNGCRVSVEDTPVTLELENHDQLDCFLEQPWTGPLPAMTSANGGRNNNAAGQQAQVWEANEGASNTAAEARAGEEEKQEGEAQAEAELRRETLEASIKAFASAQTMLEDSARKIRDLENAHSKMKQRARQMLVIMMSLLFLAGGVPLAMWVTASDSRRW
ncbi:unnamed protein product [Pylaiella littoralis]